MVLLLYERHCGRARLASTHLAGQACQSKRRSIGATVEQVARHVSLRRYLRGESRSSMSARLPLTTLARR